MTITDEADVALKTKHRAVWASGDYGAVADQVIPSLGPVLVRATGVSAGERVLDVAAGTGNAAVPAARAGARVVASDLTPDLLENGREATAGLGLAIDWREADAEALPFADGEFDVALSCVGVMFAPHHQRAADELVRVVRPGGRVGLLSWTPGGFIGQLFATLRPFVPPPPPGVQPPPLWGDEQHVRALLGHRVTDVRAVREDLVVDRFATGEEFRDFFRDHYGPTLMAYRANAADADRTAALDAAVVDLARRALDGGTTMAWEYLLLTATRV
jgi:SAM-dependent methyltransferase